MASWQNIKHEPSSINGGNQYEEKDRVSKEQLNAITENAFYAVEKADEALEKANSSFESNGTVISVGGVQRTTMDFDSDPQTQLNNLNANKVNKDLSNVTYPEVVANGVAQLGAGDRVIESFISSDGLTWYRKWVSGWKECGMTNQTTSSSGAQKLTLPIGFTTPNVTVTYSANNSSNLVTIKCKMTSDKNETDNLYYNVNVATGSGSSSYVSSTCCIYCCGY